MWRHPKSKLTVCRAAIAIVTPCSNSAAVIFIGEVGISTQKNKFKDLLFLKSTQHILPKERRGFCKHYRRSQKRIKSFCLLFSSHQVFSTVLYKGDVIAEIDGTSAHAMSHAEAVAHFKGSSRVRLGVWDGVNAHLGS